MVNTQALDLDWMKSARFKIEVWWAFGHVSSSCLKNFLA